MFVGAGDSEDLGVLDAAGLAARFKEVERQRRLVEAELAALTAEVDRRGVHREDGHASAKGWLQALGRWSGREAAAMVKSARLGHAHPIVAEALRAGEVGVAQVQRLARAHANPRVREQLPEVLELFLTHAAHMDHDDFVTIVDRWERLADMDGTNRSADIAHERRNAGIVQLGDGFLLHGQVGAWQGAVIKEVWDRFTDAEFLADWDAAKAAWGDDVAPGHLERTDTQRRADALYAVFSRAAATPPDHVDAEPLVNIVGDVTTLAQLLGVEVPESERDPRRRRSETTSGVMLPPAEVLLAMMWGRIRKVMLDPAGVVIDLGRKQRLFTGGARDAVLLQALRCLWPGCSMPAGRCQADHLIAWSDLGTTEPGNGGPLCGWHNRHKSRGYRVWRDAEGYWHTYRPDGTEIA
jgi:hypothetical protein